MKAWFKRHKKKNDDLRFSKKTEDWLGKILLEEEKKLLENDHASRIELARMFVIAKKNWLLSMGEIEELQKQIKRLQVQINILKRD